jgi:hypothetical protein
MMVVTAVVVVVVAVVALLRGPVPVCRVWPAAGLLAAAIIIPGREGVGVIEASVRVVLVVHLLQLRQDPIQLLQRRVVVVETV